MMRRIDPCTKFFAREREVVLPLAPISGFAGKEEE
jgi:hypothetical protein